MVKSTDELANDWNPGIQNDGELGSYWGIGPKRRKMTICEMCGGIGKSGGMECPTCEGLGVHPMW